MTPAGTAEPFEESEEETDPALPDGPGRSPLLTGLALGALLALTGGRDTRLRLLLTSVAVGLGVSLLLLTASVPGMVQHRNARVYAQNDTVYGSTTAPPSDRTLLIANVDTTFAGADIRGRALRPEGDRAPVPPGLTRYPPAGTMAVSPALARLLAAPGSGLLRRRLHYPVSGTIGQAGLLGPNQLSYLLGSDRLALDSGAVRIDHLGEAYAHKPMAPELVLLCLVGFVVLLAPVGVFLGAAARFGGEQRDRRLAALRLAGADRRTTGRIAAGESFAGALLGLGTGAALYLTARQLAGHITIAGLAFFPQDISPQPAIAALVLVLVPLLAVLVTLFSLRRITVDPLGAVRRSGLRGRRLWWRLLTPVLGLAILTHALRAPGDIRKNSGLALTSAGMLLLLVGTTVLLPWLVETAVRHAPGGGLSWQLAVRRLQLATGPAGTAVSGIVVAVTGAIALQMLVVGVSAHEEPKPTPAASSTSGAARQPPPEQAVVDFPLGAAQLDEYLGRARDIPGVGSAVGFAEFYISGADGSEASEARVADCATLRLFATLPGCVDGDAFIAHGRGSYDSTAFLTPGLTVTAGDDTVPRKWQLPPVRAGVTVNPDPSEDVTTGLFLATPATVPSALLKHQDATLDIAFDARRPDARDQLLTGIAQISPQATVRFPLDAPPDGNYRAVTSGLVAGSAVTLLLIAASLLVGQLERLRDQRRVLAVLYAFGTRRRVLGLSVLWQTALPMGIGLVLAVVGGLATGSALLHLAGLRVAFDWGQVLATAGLGAGAVALVTLLSLPTLLRTMRPNGLRFE